MDDRGLISVMPPYAFVFIGLLAASFFVALRMRPPPSAVLVVHVVALAVMLYGAPAFLEDMPRFPTAWLHVGFSDAIARTGELFPLDDARFDWPAFFTLAALFSTATGFEDLLPILSWIPPVIMLLYLAPLYLIMRSATSDPRHMWLAIWMFYLVNWVGQDYFSPQAFNILIMLSVTAVLLSWFRQGPGSDTWSGRFWSSASRFAPGRFRRLTVDPAGALEPLGEWAMSERQQIGLVAVVVALFGASVASHQLTPFAMLGGVIGLTVFNRIRLTGLPVLMMVLLSSWLLFMATTYLTGHLAGLLEDIGQVGTVVTASTLDRFSGSDGHLFVLQVRLGLTIGVWLIAFIGGLRRLRAGNLDLTLALLAVAPFGLVFLQGYGGEMLLRVYLFSLPFMAFFLAAAFFPSMRPASWRLDVLLVGVSIVFAFFMLFSRFGNEKADFVTLEEYQLLEFTSDLAQEGDTIGEANHSVPLGYFEWEQHNVVNVGDEFEEGHIEDLLRELLNRTPPGQQTYFVVTRGQVAFAELFWNMSAEAFAQRHARVAAAGELIFENRDGAVYHITEFPPPEVR